jgi:DNA-binding transcriptional ArsR family regulator
VIDDAAAAAVALDPVRARLLAELAEPGSAAALASRTGISRQKVNYHLNALEEHGLVELAEVRRWGGINERVMRATAASYVISPHALGVAGADPSRAGDRLSAGHLIALAGRIIAEVGEQATVADAAGVRLPTLTIDAEVGFRSAADRTAFADELTTAVLDLVERYHDDAGRRHRVVVASHPSPGPAPTGGDS